MRNVKIEFDTSAMTEIAMSNNCDWEKLWHAIGYLSTWNTTYPTVLIFRDGATDLVAIYYDEKNSPKYVIGAVWHGEHYGFHS
jgi:hypothetical protein